MWWFFSKDFFLKNYKQVWHGIFDSLQSNLFCLKQEWKRVAVVQETNFSVYGFRSLLNGSQLKNFSSCMFLSVGFKFTGTLLLLGRFLCFLVVTPSVWCIPVCPAGMAREFWLFRKRPYFPLRWSISESLLSKHRPKLCIRKQWSAAKFI